MSYLVCDKCGGYYELQPDESLEDFDSKCKCGGILKHVSVWGTENQRFSNELKYYNSLDKYPNRNNQESNYSLIKLIFIIMAILLIFGIVGIVIGHFYELHKYGLFVLLLIFS